MSTATILQLARFNSTNTPSNAEWVTNLKEPIILNQGDSISVKQAYIDSRLTSAGNIVIPVDTPISLTYYFYYMFPCDGASTITPANPIQTGLEYNWLYDSYEDNPNSFVLMAGVPGGYFTQYQNDNFTLDSNSTQTGTPQAPYAGIPQTPTGIAYPLINQSYAVEAPMLLVENIPSKDGGRPFTKTWNYTIPKGTYTPAILADMISKSMSSMLPNPSAPQSFSPFDQNNSTGSDMNPFLTIGNQMLIVNQTYDPTYPDSRPSIIPFDDATAVHANALNFFSNTPGLAGAPFAGVFGSLIKENPFVIPLASMSFSLASQVDDGYKAGSPEMAILPVKYQAQYNFFLKDTEAANNVRGIIEYTSPLVGASEISLEFNSDAGVFQFTYMHTPLQQLPVSATPGGTTVSEPIEVVKIIKTINITHLAGYTETVVPSGAVNICKQTRHSGIFFQSMEPYSFWHDTLGFDVDNITFSAEQVWGPKSIMSFEKFNEITTSSYVGILNNFSLAPGAPNLNQPAYASPFTLDNTSKEQTYTNLMNSARWYMEHYILTLGQLQFETNLANVDYELFASRYYEEYSSAAITTNPVQAIQPPLSNIASSGHYLINIDEYSNTKNDFINQDNVYKIKSIVSNYYLALGSFATQPFQDSAIYVHNSPIPKVIDTFRVRLIEPTTMENISGLGPNSSVYLQVNKIISEVAVSQTY